jgi:hypothetical protein
MPASLVTASLLVLRLLLWPVYAPTASAQTPAESVTPPLLDSAPAARPRQASHSEEPSVRLPDLVSPSLVIVRAGVGGKVTAQGTGVVAREDGLILVPHHVVRDAAQVQVTLKDGETYDRAELLGVDERRGVAALRVPVKGLRAIKVRAVTDEQIGGRFFALTTPAGSDWTFSDGLLWVFSDARLSGIRLADDVPGAGRGFKLLQFAASTPTGASGGLLVDEEGHGVGLIAGGYGGQGQSFAVPLAAVVGLTEHQPRQTFASGLTLGAAGRDRIAEPRGGDVAQAGRGGPADKARLIYVEIRTSLCKPVMLHNALLKYAPQLDEWRLKVVDELRLADLVVTVEHLPMTFYYTFSIRDVRAGTILGAGRVTAWDCHVAAPELAKGIVRRLGALHKPPELQRAEPPKQGL